MPQIRIGISGWRYAGWRGDFYPRGLPQRRELEYVSRRLSTVEVNGSFYSLQRPGYWRAWAAETPEDFVFAVKGGRFVTHMKKLRDVEAPLANFFASGLLALDRKLGPVLWQLPPQLPYEPARIEGFLAQLPRSTRAAAALAARHDERMEGRSWYDVRVDRPLRHAVEVRHDSYVAPGFVEQLRAAGVALVTADTAGKWPLLDEATADFAYARLHGDEELYVSGYSDEALDRWAERIRCWARDRDVFVYFDNDVKVRAPYDAMALAARLGAAPSGPSDPSSPS